MDTVSHMFWNGLFFKDSKEKRNIVIGGLLPDIALIISAVVLTPTRLFSPFRPWAQQLMQIPELYLVDTLFHSLPFWTASLVLYRLFRLKGYGIWIGASIHIFIDVLTHKFDIVPYLWPISSVKPEGIIDYRTGNFTLLNWLVITVIVVFLLRKRIRKILKNREGST
ncbi:MAG: hypothetical protein ACOYWZ_07505 [Bacillota bacterium]